MDWRAPLLNDLIESFDVNEKWYKDSKLAHLEKAASMFTYCSEGERLLCAIRKKRQDIRDNYQKYKKLLDDHCQNVSELDEAREFFVFYWDVFEDVKEQIDRCNEQIYELNWIKEEERRRRNRIIKIISRMVVLLVVMLITIYVVKDNRINKMYLSKAIEAYEQGHYDDAYQVILEAGPRIKNRKSFDLNQFTADYLKYLVQTDGYCEAFRKLKELQDADLISTRDDVSKKFVEQMIDFIESADRDQIENAKELSELLIENEVISADGWTGRIIAGNVWCIDVMNKLDTGDLQKAIDLVMEATSNNLYPEMLVNPDYALKMIYQLANEGCSMSELFPYGIRIPLDVAEHVLQMNASIMGDGQDADKIANSDNVNLEKVIALYVKETTDGDIGKFNYFKKRLWSGYQDKEEIADGVRKIQSRKDHYEVYLLPEEQMMIAQERRAENFQECTSWLIKGNSYYQDGIYEPKEPESSDNIHRPDNFKRPGNKKNELPKYYYPTFSLLDTVSFWIPDQPGIEWRQYIEINMSKKAKIQAQQPIYDWAMNDVFAQISRRVSEDSLVRIKEKYDLLEGAEYLNAEMLGSSKKKALDEAYRNVIDFLADEGEVD